MDDALNATGVGQTDWHDGACRVAEIIGGTAGKIVATGTIVGEKLGALHRSDMNEIDDAANSAIREGKTLAKDAIDFARHATDYLGSHDRRQIVRDVGRLVRDHPAEALAVAAAIGFLVDRVMLRRRG